MAITALGLGTKQAPDNVNLDPQRQFWSWLAPFIHPNEKTADNYHHQRGYFNGFACTQTTPAGMSIQIGGMGSVDSALLVLGGGRCVLLSTDGEPEIVTIPTAPASGSRIDAVVSYIDTTSADAEAETPGTPEYVHTIVVSGTATSSPTAPTDAEIVSALPAGAGGIYYRWCDVRVAQGATVITNSNITDRKPTPPNLYSATSVYNNVFNVLGLDVSFCVRNGVCFIHADGKINGATGTRYASTNTLPQNVFDAITSAGTFRKFIVWGSNGTMGQGHFAGDRKLYMYFPESIPSGTSVIFIGSWPVANEVQD